MSNTKNAVAYIRVSTEMQIDAYSIDGQLEEIKNYCKRNNINLLKYYEDKGISGTSTKDRVSFQKMLNDIEKQKNIDTVIVWKLSRLSRSMVDLANTVSFLEKNNVNLICITQGIDTSTAMGKSFVYMAGIFAEIERDNIIETCRMGMKQRAMQGLWNGGKVFGYRSNESKELVIHEDEAKIIREIFDLFTNKSWGYKKIASYLNNKGSKTMKGTNWSITSIKQIVDNPIYSGYIKWGEHTDWSKKRRKGKQEEFILVEGKHIPIINKDIWTKSQEIRKIRGNKTQKVYEGNFLLSGLVKCPVCGSSMISHRTPKKGKVGEYYRYYQCSNFFNKGSSVCKSNLVNADIAEAYVLNRINEIVNSKEIINAIIKKVEKESTIDTSHLEIELKRLKKEIETINVKKSETLELEYQNKIDINTLTQRLSFLDKKEATVNKQIKSIEVELSTNENQVNIKPKMIKAILENFTKIFNNSNITKKKLLLKSIIDSISIHQGKTTKDRIVDKIKLYFEPQEVEALNSNKKFATTYGTVLRIASK